MKGALPRGHVGECYMLNKKMIFKILRDATEKNPYCLFCWHFDDETLMSWTKYILECDEIKKLGNIIISETAKEVLDNFNVFFFSDETDGEYIPILKKDLKMYMIEIAKMFGVNYEKEFKNI